MSGIIKLELPRTSGDFYLQKYEFRDKAWVLNLERRYCETLGGMDGWSCTASLRLRDEAFDDVTFSTKKATLQAAVDRISEFSGLRFVLEEVKAQPPEPLPF